MSENNKRTPAPWSIGPKIHPYGVYAGAAAHGVRVCTAELSRVTPLGGGGYAILDKEARANALLLAAAPDLLAYAKLESEYSRLADRSETFDVDALVKWAEANGCDGANGEPIGAWLGRVRAAAIGKAEGGAA